MSQQINYFDSSLIFAGMAGVRGSTWEGSCLALNYKTNFKGTDSDKRSSLLQWIIIYGLKIVKLPLPRVNPIKILRP
jgi:hypothetical protein